MKTTETEIMREIIEFAGHKFVLRVDGQQLVALVATIELACRNPAFHGPTRVLVEMLSTSLKRIAHQAAPDLDLLESVFNISWTADPNPKPPVDSTAPVCPGV